MDSEEKCEVVARAFIRTLNAPGARPLKKDRTEMGEQFENPDWWPSPPLIKRADVPPTSILRVDIQIYLVTCAG